MVLPLPTPCPLTFLRSPLLSALCRPILFPLACLKLVAYPHESPCLPLFALCLCCPFHIDAMPPFPLPLPCCTMDVPTYLGTPRHVPVESRPPIR